MDYTRPQTAPLTEAEMIARYGYAAEQLRDMRWRVRK